MDALERRKTWIAAALGKTALDLIIRNVHLVNVYTSSILLTSLGIKDGHIVTLHADGLETADTFDAQGQYALPGLIDTHVHLDSTLLAPENLGQLIVPHGTTAMLTDPMESANVGGFEGLRALLTSRDELPYHLLLEVSSRVPTAPGLETTGGELDVAAVQHILSWETSVSLGELDPSKVLGMRDEYLQKVLLAHQAGKIANGHAAGLTGRELEAYVCGGLSDDHETLDYREALERLRYGLPVLIREGSTERNLELILKGVIEDGLDTRHLMFCTDDKHPDDILEEGHIDYMVNRAIEMGLDPIRAIQMATLNAAEHFRLEQRIGSLTPGREADILLTSRLDLIQPTHVFFGGQLVARDGKMVIPVAPENYPSWFFDTVHVTRGRQAADFRLPAPTESAATAETVASEKAAATARVNVIEISGEQILNQWGQAELPVQDGRVMMNPAADLLKLAVVERHGKNGNIGITFVKGFGLKRGALASSVSHDHHNIVIVGTNDEDMAVCVRAVAAMHGGLVVAAGGEVLASLPLPLGGLMSDRPVGEVIERLNTLNDLAHHLGSELPAPFMTLSFISLPTVPELGLTDLGLVDVRHNCLISPFAE